MPLVKPLRRAGYKRVRMLPQGMSCPGIWN
ncbi:hypothetical protein AG1IA_05492 [Rhizoctonia solani AG-1 IA]|uniref:Uncharacterized protein n=1 Tax=Thanatephorus cucumeris (strain AG1-IA) TaxID=983506 RepID=L8WVU6_THACA|nr:hypothetical protein AG1IA_05492 [Rhizoctonia solani AG-1 IA]